MSREVIRLFQFIPRLNVTYFGLITRGIEYVISKIYCEGIDETKFV